MRQTNMILIMCDDLGYGDTGFNGHSVIRTPHLDRMAREGATFARFYAGAPVCSPTRGTCLTGRHHYRYGITTANNGMLPREEITVAGALKSKGYATGHFGKWHLGTLSRDIPDGRRGGAEHPDYYSPPWEHGFDTCFSTEAQVPLWNPMDGQRYPSRYWHGEGQYATDRLEGDDSNVIMDRVIPFIERAAEGHTPFLAVVWFHAPHNPVIAGPPYLDMYAGYSEDEQHYYGCITAMDEQIGRLNETLKRLGLEDDTLVWFCSDNGPEGKEGGNDGRNRGSTGGLRGRKRSLFTGGFGVPAVIRWPARIRPGTVLDMPCSTLDFFPTLADAVGYTMPDARPIDGVNLLPYFNGEWTRRPKPIVYRFAAKRSRMFGSPTLAVIDNEYKLLTNFSENADEDMLFHLVDDPREQTNRIADRRPLAADLKAFLRQAVADFERSHYGGDYPGGDYRPLRPFVSNEQGWTE